MSTSRELRIFDTSTWQQLGKFPTSVPFWSAAASNDGRLLYALAPEQHSVLVIDIATGEERQPIRIGETPSLALVAP
jgi:outer membrane protein assembly factor BamB